MSALATVGKPDGPEKFIDEIGYAVGTFTSRREDLEEDARRKALPCVMYHVPVAMRGPYRIADLPESLRKKRYKTNADGYVMCRSANKRARAVDSKECNKRAMNRSPFCDVHGGRLHPSDRSIRPEVDVTKLTRWEQLCRGIISVDDLDDEELLRGMTRRPNGSFPGGAGKAVPRKVYDKMVARLFERAQEMFRENLFTAIERLATITASDSFEPVDQIKAATIIIDRVLGKAPEKIDVNVGQQKPFEQIISSIGGTRAEFLAERAQTQIVDAEIVDTEGDSPWQQIANVGQHNSDIAIEPAEDPAAQRVPEERPSTMSDPAGTKKRRRVIRRENYDTEQAYRTDLKLEQAEAKADRDAAQKRRYVARAQGRTSTANLAYRSHRFVDENGERRRQWIHPNDVVVPSAEKAKMTRRRNVDRD